MKEYKKPEVVVFELRSEEKIALSQPRGTKVKVNGALLSAFNLAQNAVSDEN